MLGKKLTHSTEEREKAFCWVSQQKQANELYPRRFSPLGKCYGKGKRTSKRVARVRQLIADPTRFPFVRHANGEGETARSFHLSPTVDHTRRYTQRRREFS